MRGETGVPALLPQAGCVGMHVGCAAEALTCLAFSVALSGPAVPRDCSGMTLCCGSSAAPEAWCATCCVLCCLQVKEVLKQVAVPVATAQRMHSDISRLKNCFTTVHGWVGVGPGGVLLLAGNGQNQ